MRNFRSRVASTSVGISPALLLRCPLSQPQNAHLTAGAPKNPRLVPLARAPLARHLDRSLLARLGPREFSPPLRHRRNPHLHRPLGQQRAPHFQPSRVIGTDRHCLDPRHSHQIDFPAATLSAAQNISSTPPLRSGPGSSRSSTSSCPSYCSGRSAAWAMTVAVGNYNPPSWSPS